MIKARHLKRTLCLLFLLVSADMTTGISLSLQKIQTTLASVGKDVKTKVQEISDYLKSSEGNSTMATITQSINTMGKAVTSVTSTNTLEMVSGVLSMASAVTSLIPKAGPILGAIFSVVSSILSAVGGKPSGIESVVKKEIEKALINYDDSRLRSEASGAVRVYRISQAYLNSLKGDTPINEHEVAALAAHVPVYQGVSFLGILAYKIKENAVSNENEQVRRAMQYTELYVTLAVMRTTILWEMYSVVRAASNSESTARAIKGVAKAEEEADTTFIKFLVNYEYSRAVFFSNFYSSDWPVTIKFLGEKGLQYQRLKYLHENIQYMFSPQKWRNWYIYLWFLLYFKGNNFFEENWRYDELRGTTSQSKADSVFYMYPVKGLENVVHIRTRDNPKLYIYYNTENDNCRGSRSVPGKEGEWKIVQFNDGYSTFSPRSWPNYFMYMKNNDVGRISIWKGDPGKEGHWLIRMMATVGR